VLCSLTRLVLVQAHTLSLSHSLSLTDAWIWYSLTDQSSTLSQYALELNWSVGTTWRFARDDPYSEVSFDAAL